MIQTDVLLSSLEAGYRLHYERGAFSAVQEKKSRCCLIKRRAPGEVSKHLEAVKPALAAFNTALSDHKISDQETLFDLRKALFKKVSYINRHTKGFFGWLLSLFRKKADTKAMRELGSELLKTYKLIDRTEGVATKILDHKINLAQNNLFKMIQKELPHAVRQKTVTLQDFGITETNAVPTTPFILIKSGKDSYQLALPPNDLDAPHQGQVKIVNIRNLFEIRELYKQHILEKKALLFQAANVAIGDRFEVIDIRTDINTVLKKHNVFNQSLDITYFNPLNGTLEKEVLKLNSLMTKEFVNNWIESVRQSNRNRLQTVQAFINQKFGSNAVSADGMTYDWSGKFGFEYTIDGKKAQFATPGLGEHYYQKCLESKNQIKENIDYLEKLRAADLTKAQENRPFFIDGKEFQIHFNPSKQVYEVFEETSPVLYATIKVGENLREEINHLRFKQVINKFMTFNPEILSQLSPISSAGIVAKIPGISVDELKKLAKSQKLDPGVLRKADEGRPISRSRVLENITVFLDIIRCYKRGDQFHFSGIPVPPKERRVYFDALEGRLTHLIKVFRQPENRPFLALFVTDLGASIPKCGKRWFDEVSKYYNLLCVPEVNETNIELDRWFQHFIDLDKDSVVEKMVAATDSFQPGHVRGRYKNTLKQSQILVPDCEATFSDPYENCGGGLMGTKIVEEFNKQFSPTLSFLGIKSELNKRLRNVNSPEVIQNMGSQVFNRLKMVLKNNLLQLYPKPYAEFLKCDTEQQRDAFLETFLDDNGFVTTHAKDDYINGITTKGLIALGLQTQKLKAKSDQETLDLLNCFD